MKRSTGASSSTGSQPCAACRYQRKKCPPDCTLAPYFTVDKKNDFDKARKHFGIGKMINLIESVDSDLRNDCAKSMVFEADIRAAYPVGGCHQYTLDLQQQIYWTSLELKNIQDQIAFCKAQKEATQQQSLQQNQMVQAVDNDQSLEGFNMYNNTQAQATQQQYFAQNQMVQAVDGHVQGQFNAFQDQGFEGFNMSNSQARATQQQYQGQNQIVQANAFDDQSWEGFDMDNTMPEHLQHCQEETDNFFQSSYGGSSSSSTVYNLFDLVNDQSEAPAVGDDIMPLLDMFGEREEEGFPFDSRGSNSQSGDQLVSKEDSGSTQHNELKNAASQFTLKNSEDR